MTLDISLEPQRARQRLEWARTRLGDGAADIERASVDAGFRSYWRVTGRNGSHIVMDAPPGLEDPRPWLRMRELLLAHGLRVPALLAQDLGAGFLLLEDLGAPTLARLLDADNADAWFDRAMEQLIRLQSIPVPEGFGHFGEALLQRDAGLFDEWFLQRHLGLQLDCGEVEGLQLAQRRLMDNALGQAQLMTHRDFMPRNLMPVADGPAVLDFQDLVRGPIAYDPVSLFKDAFLSWPLQRVDGWLARYHERARAAGLPVPDRATFLRDADWMGVQRHLKILGIFSRLHYRDGKSHYLEDVPRFIAYLDEVLPRHPQLSGLLALLEQRIKPALAGRAAQ
ncbi:MULTISPECIES: aminoglycoside phosphotransferase family protein [Stenotrophomonas]|uniref:Aminoglycoside phosphotransferase n=1 Tax=Stenotrophomonas nitritireducens TaxID=83617 RepID=A0ABR5NGE4_9GAMM|nr:MULTISPECIES: phosphotransferase [Stenotrophomonas]KQN96470.1 aminoglycoside phosphotransferase [Stenotrophomonas sp. Leaf70]KRG54765.1 aminoglycoside phosphotransferase [Stenotrophomonas nitritireducens]